MEHNLKSYLKLVFPSILGILLFLVPVNHNGASGIVVGIIGNWVKSVLSSAFVPILLIIILLSTGISLWHRFFPISLISKNERLNTFFSPSLFWLIVRCVGALITVLTYFQWGFEYVWSMNTGGNMLYSILPTCAVWYIVGGFFLPLLTDYGLLDVLSFYFKRIAWTLFRVPGRAMIDCVTSWLGSSVCGTYLTLAQYEDGYYSAREASVIISNFSLLSVSFCFLISSMLGLENMFGKFYLTIVIAGIACAIITPRIWPLRHIPDTYDSRIGKQVDDTIPQGTSTFKWAIHKGVLRAESAPNLTCLLKKGIFTSADLMLTTLPVIMAFGTIALIVATYTPLFDYLGIPLGAILSLFNVPDAMAAGSAILVGFADQFIPVIIGSTMPSIFTRFVIGCLSILQILYISDIGSLIMTSRLPLNLWKMFIIFLERILVSLPIVILCAHLFGIV